MIGIYKIQNKVSSKVYIGQSIDIESRWYSHIKELRENKHRNEHLQNSWNKYGEENFIFEIVEECKEENLTKREQYWIDYYGGKESETTYNQRDAGNNGSLSNETRKKLSEINKGKPAWNKGLTADTDIRVRNYTNKLKGCHLSEDMKKRISATVKRHHEEGVYDYELSNKKRLKTIEENKKSGKIRKVRKDKGVKKSKEVGNHVSEGKLNANKRKKELGLPLRNNKNATPLKISECVVCGKHFYQRRCRTKKTCSKECRYLQMIESREGRYIK